MATIHEKAGWPRLSWDGDALAVSLAAVRHRQGRLLGRMEALGFPLRQDANLTALTMEAQKTSAIEGETLDFDEVRSSIILCRSLCLRAIRSSAPRAVWP